MLLLILVTCAASGRDKKEGDKKPESKPGCNRRFLGVSTGLNNSVGLVGGLADFGVGSHYSIEGGMGISSWGLKYTVGTKYYLKPCFMGWAFGAGLTRNTGTQEFETTLLREDKTSAAATLKLRPVHSIYAAAFNYTSLGKKGHRFYVMLGLTRRISSNPFEQLSGTPIDEVGKDIMRKTTPGWIPLVCGIGFSFALGE